MKKLGSKHSFLECQLLFLIAEATQPFCDGKHKEETDFKPVSFIPEKSGKVYLCGCKHTKKPPYCDGTHTSLVED